MKAKTSANEVLNWWLRKYHNTTIEELKELNPDMSDRDFFLSHQVTQAQHDEWHEWMIITIMKDYRISKKRAKRDSWLIYLNLSPMVKNEIL